MGKEFVPSLSPFGTPTVRFEGGREFLSDVLQLHFPESPGDVVSKTPAHAVIVLARQAVAVCGSPIEVPQRAVRPIQIVTLHGVGQFAAPQSSMVDLAVARII